MPAAEIFSTRERIPNPDPTSLTTAQLDKAIEAQAKLFDARMHCSEENIIRVDGKIADRQDTIDKTVAHLQALQDEKFRGVQTQFAERDTRADKIAELNQKAIDAALTAAEKARVNQSEGSDKAIAKSEAATTKELDALKLSIQGAVKTTEDKISAIKELMAATNGAQTGRQGATDNSRANVAILVSAITVIVSIASVILAVVLR